MHTAMIVGGGFLTLVLMIAAGKLMGWPTPRSATAFLPVWLVATLANMWVGVTQAGYTVQQEAPIALLVFAVPALIAWLVAQATR